MKRLIVFLTIIFLLSITVVSAAPAGAVAPTPVKPTLAAAKVEVTTAGGGIYKVKQELTIVGAAAIKDGKVELLFSKINNAQVDSLVIKTNEKILQVSSTTGSVLDKLYFNLPAGTTNQFVYQIEYRVTLPKDVFTVPLIVPNYATTGKELCVVIDYIGPKGTFIQENSFPEVHSPKGHSIESVLANLPSHVSYVYADSPSSFFNSYNMISVVVFFILVIIIAKWIRTEIFKK